MNKQELIALCKELLNEENLDDRSSDLQLLRREYKFLLGRDEDSFAEQEETDKFIALFNELAKKEPKLLVSPYEEKKRIIEAAKKLLEKKCRVRSASVMKAKTVSELLSVWQHAVSLQEQDRY